MKKLMILSLVLAVAGLANAGFEVKYADGAAGVMAGETFRVEWVNDQGALGNLNIRHITDSGAGKLSEVFLNPQITFGRQIRNIVNQSQDLVLHATGTAIGGSTALGAPKVEMNQLIFAFDIATDAGLAPGDYVLNFVVGTWNDHGVDGGGAYVARTLGSLTYTVVPEPITMGLLGLGGLFIRRRK